MSRGLFRQEAIDAQREKYLGETTLARPVAYWVYTLLAAAIAAILLAVAIWGQYTRRERVEGSLALDVGAARVLIPEAGRVADLLIKEGDEVAAGAPIARIAYDRAAAETSAQELASRRLLLEREQAQLRELGEQQVAQVRKRVKDLEGEIAQADREIRLQDTRVKSAREQAARYQQLAGEKFVSDLVVRQKQDEVTEQEIKLQALRRTRSQIERDLSAAKLEEPSLQLKSRGQVDQVERQLSELQESLAGAQARRETLIKAPVHGTVTNIAVTAGQSVAADAPLATVLPKGSGLHAELLVPTRAIGFIQKGQAVVLRYEAFPHERFGQYQGTVTEISRSVWSPGDKLGPLTVKEPVYRVDVKLERQSVAALGNEIPLRPGMLVNADILLERRTLLEWLFEPVLQLRGRL
ncbi:MAG TPA: HlyD family efflux transporter periplasmic adaptor subunit [Usitatibacteraceae bacterium]|nr:HlyD family efflux transporter periplasmic adaptor subunit [Usitatibacteraceae bacterium]